MGKALEEVPGVTAGFQYPVQMRFNELMTGARQDVVCKIFGEDLDTLTTYANKMGEIVNTVEGARNLYVEKVSGMPQVIIAYKRDMIAQYNLTISDINRIVNTALAGQSTGMVFEGEKRFELVVRLAGEQKKDIQDIQNLLILTPQGTQIPLSQLADVAIKDGPNQIQREDAKRRIVVGFNVRGRDVQSIVNELQAKIDKKIKFPTGYYVTYGGAFENLNAAKQRLMIAVPVSLILIFLLLFFAFNSVKHGLLIYSAIPLSAIGGIFFLAMRGLPFSISAGVGFIALFGVAVLNGIVLIAEFNRLKQDGLDDLKKTVLLGTKVRLRPVLMTAFVASLGFLPMALSNGAGAEVQRPLATVVIGGLLVATFLTLFVLPILYIIFEGSTKKTTPKAAIIAIILAFGWSANAQTPVALQSAIDVALKNNLSIKNEKLKADYQKSLINTAKMLPSANISVEAGQINSIYADTRFALGQSFSFPKVYESQKNLLIEHWKSSELNVKMTEQILKKQVTQTFYHLLYLQQKSQLLQFADSLYAAFYDRAELRLAKGESNVLEKITAENQLGQIRVQLNQLKQDVEVQQLHFQYLLNSTTPLIPLESSFKISINYKADIEALKGHPTMKFLSQQQQISDATIEVEKKKLLPTMAFNYNNGSIRGTGADNKTYGGFYRFQSIQVGVGIPIFRAAQKAKINSERVNKLVAESSYSAALQALNTDYQAAIIEYEKFQKTVEYFEKKALNNSTLISTTAQQQLVNGSINYLEWVTLINQATTIRNDYIEAIRNLNESAIQINYLVQF